MTTHNRQHSTPATVTSMSALLKEPLDAFVGAFIFETAGNETPYLFRESPYLQTHTHHLLIQIASRVHRPDRRHDALSAVVAMERRRQGVFQEALTGPRGAAAKASEGELHYLAYAYLP